VTAAILKSIRQQLRSRWVRCVVCLCALIVGYVASAGSMIGLAFHPRVSSLPFSNQVREATFALYTPAILICRSRCCLKMIPQFLSWSIGRQRKRVAMHAMHVGQRDFQFNRTRQKPSHPRLSTPNLDRVALKPGFCSWRGQQLLSFGSSLFKDHNDAVIAESKANSFIMSSSPSQPVGLTPRSGGQDEDGVTVAAMMTLRDPIATMSQHFDDRPDLILSDFDSDRFIVDETVRPFKVSVIDLRDEQDVSTTLSGSSTSLYTLRVASPELLLDESQVVQLQRPSETSAEDATNRIFPVLGNRIVCQKEFPERDHRAELFSFSLGFNR
jgi:hypothetical protein